MANIFLDALSQAKTAYQNVGDKIKGGVRDFMIDLPANSAYLQNQVMSKIAPKQNIPTYEQKVRLWQQTQGIDKVMAANPVTWDQPTKSMSAQMNPYLIAPQNQELETLKQRVLSSPAWRPAMKRYLSTVPVVGDPSLPAPNMSGGTDITNYQTYDRVPTEALPENTSWEESQGPYQPVINMNIPRWKDERNRGADILAHEYIHTAPRQQQYKQDFIKLFESISQESNPILYNISLQYYNNGRPAPNPEEFYATLGQIMGPKVLNIPEVRKFYQNVFRR